jgi:hypothetical protein
MKIENIGTLIAERELDGRYNGKPCKVTVRFGKPFFDESSDGSCWYCPYSIASPEGQRVFYGAGLDAQQALRIAISMARAELTSLHSELRVKWIVMCNRRPFRTRERMDTVVSNPSLCESASGEQVKGCFRFSLPDETLGNSTFRAFCDPIGPVISDRAAENLRRIGFLASQPKPGKTSDATFVVSFGRFKISVIFIAERVSGDIKCWIFTGPTRSRWRWRRSLHDPFPESEWVRVCDAIEEAVKQYPGVESFERITRTEAMRDF